MDVSTKFSVDKRFGWLRPNLHTTVTARIERYPEHVQTPTHSPTRTHIYTECIHEKEKSERSWCQHAHRQYLFLSRTNTHTHKGTRKAEAGRSQTTVRLTEYFIMFLLACQEHLRTAAYVCLYSICVCICADLNYIRVCADDFIVFVYLCLWQGLTGCCCDWLSRQCSLESLWAAAAVSSSGLSDAPGSRQVTWWFWQGGKLSSRVEK